MNFIENIFKIKENNTTVKTEILAGITTFFTMSYLYVLSPKILENAGLEFGSTLTVTALIAFIGSILMAFIANKPYAVAPFLGETAFVAYTMVAALGFSIKTVLASISVCGVLLLIMTLTNIRGYILEQIPENIKQSFCIGLGLFFIFIALRDIGIVNFTANSIPIEAGNFTSLPVLLGVFCFVLLIVLVKKKMNAAVIAAISITTILGMVLGDIELPSKIISFPSGISSSVLQVDYTGILDKEFIPMLYIIFLLVNIDTSGAIVGLSYKGDVDCRNNRTGLKKTMIADSLSVIIAPLLGTTTPGAYLDSMTGISAGGRTGLTSLTVGVLFIAGLIFTPLIMIIPPYAYAPALLYVGILMTSVITKIDFNDITEYAPAIMTICIMIFTYNIGIGIISGFIIYPLIKLFSAQRKDINITTWIMFFLSVLFFAIKQFSVF